MFILALLRKEDIGSAGFFPLILIALFVVFLFPIVMATRAALAATKYKTYVFVITYFEWLGWVVCLTIIGIPVGLGLVLSSQAARILVDIEANTREATKSNALR